MKRLPALRGLVPLGLALLTGATLGAQTRTPVGPPPPPGTAPLQCWWRTSSGAIHVGEILEVTLTCAARDDEQVRAVPDESRLTVAAVQMAPWEIVGGSHPPDTRAGGRRFFQYVYQVRAIDPDAIGRDVKLPALVIPYKLESRVGADATLAGRDLSHVMPQLAVRMLSLVPTEAVDIRDTTNVSLGRVEALRFRARGFGLAGTVFAVLAAVAALGALAPLAGRLRTRRPGAAGGVSDRAALVHAAGVLDDVLQRARADEWTAEGIADAHRAARLVTAIALGSDWRQQRLETPATAEGRLVVPGRWRRPATALTARVTPGAVDRALNARAAASGATSRVRLERLRDGLVALTRAQYSQGAVDRAAVEEAAGAARDIAREIARERLWSPRTWFARRTPHPAAAER